GASLAPKLWRRRGDDVRAGGYPLLGAVPKYGTALLIVFRAGESMARCAVARPRALGLGLDSQKEEKRDVLAK
ncbi:MAG TPA: hypothetical protein DCY84_09680, partial [Firmicutes bacterium]|nr:hypothetical protein [Bacillota bacterium]HBG44917.1 hypothetical protein [Bacillota bacterium]HBR24894.1 hypothetical protein [Bacillota bacterium]